MDPLTEDDRAKYATVLAEIAKVKTDLNEDLLTFVAAAFPPIPGTRWTANLAHALTMRPALSPVAKQEADDFLKRALQQWTTSPSYVQWHHYGSALVRIVNELVSS